MKLAQVFSAFDSNVRFFPVNLGSLDLSTQINADSERWLDSPTGEWIATALVSNKAEGGVGSWHDALNELAALETVPAAAVFLLVDRLEDTDERELLALIAASNLGFIAVVPLEHEFFSAAFIASPDTSSAIGHQIELSRLLLADALTRSKDSEPVGNAVIEGKFQNVADRNARDAEHHEPARRSEARDVADIEALRNELTRAQLRTKAANEQFRSVKNSSAYRLGNLLGRSARNPVWAVVGLPKGIAAIVRDRDSAAAQASRARDALSEVEGYGADGRSTVGLHSGVADALQSRLRFRNGSAARQPAPIVAYVSHPAFGGMRRSTWETDLTPNDYLESLERDLPTAIVVDSAAFMAGSPWAGGATGEDPKKTTAVLELLFAAQRYGIPCVFRWHCAPTMLPGVMRLAQTCDIEVATSDRVGRGRFPPLAQGIALDNWAAPASRPAQHALAMFETTDLVPSRDRGEKVREPQLIDTRGSPHPLPEVAIDPAVLGRPRSMRSLLQGTTIARFPAFDGVPLPVIETLALGRPVIGSRSDRFKEVTYDAGSFGWSLEECDATRDQALGQLADTRWTAWQNQSTVSATRTLGGLLGSSDLASHGRVSALVVCNEPLSDEHRAELETLAGDIASAICIEDGDLGESTQRVARAISAAGATSRVASRWGDAAAAVRELTGHGGRVWLTSLTDLREGSQPSLREALTSTAPARQVETLISNEDLLGLTDETAGRALESLVASPRRAGRLNE
jgi:hypothetical protein